VTFGAMPSSTIADLPPIAVALGDPAGIGPEVVGKAWEARENAALRPFFAVGDRLALRAGWGGPVQRISEPSEAAAVFGSALPLIQIEAGGDTRPGQPALEGARAALDSLELAVGLARSGTASALTTGPVAKAQLYAIGFVHPGQTEFIAERCGVAAENAVMMLAGPSLRTVPVTIHVPLKDVADRLSVELVVTRARITARALQRDFGVAKPRLAFAGFNPHAGEGGAIGREEIEILGPAIEQLRNEGIDAIGPLAADTMFHARARAAYDAAICLYHDQALIPIKTLHFDEGVNVTLGLPVIRTAPDHGTAFQIAGSGMAHPGAMTAAIALAGACAERRAAAG
jgi:4-hydroxythreonine-4-phosphate dehydrogenase